MRTFYQYPDMGWQSTGSYAQPSAVGRVVEDGSSQISRYEYNARGRKTKEIDPLLRETVYVYGHEQRPRRQPHDRRGHRPAPGEAQERRHLRRPRELHLQRPASAADDHRRGGSNHHLHLQRRGPGADRRDARSERPTRRGERRPSPTTRTVPSERDWPGARSDHSFTYDGYGRGRTTTDSDGLHRSPTTTTPSTGSRR